jgi:tetratricopeptide (TPR) repeat protein
MESTSSQTAAPVPTPTAKRKAKSPRGVFWWLFWIGLAAVVVIEIPDEIARWQLAMALERQSEGDLAGALDSYAKILAHDPDNIDVLKSRATLLQKLGRPVEAVDDWKHIVEVSEKNGPAPNAENRNGIAYARALANVELDQGLADVEIALQEIAKNGAFPFVQAMYLDTRGYLYVLRGKGDDLKLAEQDLNQAIKSMQAVVQQQQLLALQPSLAVLHHHRGELYEKLGDSEKAELDFEAARRFHYEPEVGKVKG